MVITLENLFGSIGLNNVQGRSRYSDQSNLWSDLFSRKMGVSFVQFIGLVKGCITSVVIFLVSDFSAH